AGSQGARPRVAGTRRRRGGRRRFGPGPAGCQYLPSPRSLRRDADLNVSFLLSLDQRRVPCFSQFVSFVAGGHHSDLGWLRFLRTVLHVAGGEKLLCARRSLQDESTDATELRA